MYRGKIISALALGFAFLATGAAAQPAGYPADYDKIVTAGEQEGKVTIYTSTDQSYAQKLIDDFSKLYPGITVDYNDIGTTNTYTRVISEAAADQVTADIVWSNAVDLQVKLVDDGYAQEYDSPERGNIPAWAVYNNTAYGSTLEPVGVGYNKLLLPANLVPHTRVDLLNLLRDHADLLNGKVASFDPEKSGSAFLIQASDAKYSKDFWDLITLFGKLHGKVYPSAGQIRETILSGENILVFNHSGPYMIEWAQSGPTVGVAFFSDYNLTLTRPALISKDAPHINAAKLFLDFMLSAQGQKDLAAGKMPAIRADLGAGVYDIHAMEKMSGGKLTPVPVSKELLQYQDPATRGDFLRKWNAARGK